MGIQINGQTDNISAVDGSLSVDGTVTQQTIRLSGSTSGYVDLTAPAVAGNNSLVFPAATGTLDRLNRAGNILQVVSTTKLDVFSSTSGSFVDITGLSLSITPSSASSKILVMCQISVSGSTWNGGPILLNLLRGSTALSVGTGGSVNNSTAIYNAWANSSGNTEGNISPVIVVFLDSPSATSSLTYKIQGLISNNGFNWYINRKADNDQIGASSSITAMEVAA
jgi:hypothetical protein